MLEDYAYLGDLGKVQGREFDLDEFNGRWCVTPEFPRGTYAYFTAIDAAPIFISPAGPMRGNFAARIALAAS